MATTTVTDVAEDTDTLTAVSVTAPNVRRTPSRHPDTFRDVDTETPWSGTTRRSHRPSRWHRPQRRGHIEFTLTVSDGTATVSDKVTVTITDSANTAPTVNAGDDQEAAEGAT